MKKILMQRAFGMSLVALGVGIIPFLNAKGELEKPVTVTIPFERGVTIDSDETHLIRKAMKESLSRPGASIVISGHTGSRGDTQANLNLADQRAEAVAEALIELGLDRQRIKTAGLGGAEPLPKNDGESDRAYQRRLSRADVLIAP